MPKTILVTGGAGYIGSFMVRALLSAGFSVVVLDSLENGHREAVDKRAQFERVNLNDRVRTAAVFKKYAIFAVIDFAAYLSVGESMEEPKKYLDNNAANFINLLDEMVKSNCRYLIKSSTASTYGNPADKYFPLKENYQQIFKPKVSAMLSGQWPVGRRKRKTFGEDFFNRLVEYYQKIAKKRAELALNSDDLSMLRIPASVYGFSKMLDEIIMKKYEKFTQINHIALRYFNVSGAAPDGSIGEDKPKPTTLMTLCFWNILGKIPEVSIFGTDYPTKDGTGIRDYIHPLDLASGHLAALRYLEKENKSQTLNLGRGEGYSVFEVIKAVEAAAGQKVSCKIAGRRSGDPAVSYADPKRALKLLGWKARYNLKDMAESAWRWHSLHPQGYKDRS